MKRSRILVRFSGETSIKGKKTRERFCDRLGANMRDALGRAGIESEIERSWSRFVVDAEDPSAIEVLRRVFGVRSVSAIETRPWSDLGNIVEEGAQIFAEEVAGRRFAVRARRSGSVRITQFDSVDVERALGAALRPYAASVDLNHPEVTAGVEVHSDKVHFYTQARLGPGGLPTGVEGRALALISGGFDSAVAAWMTLKRGVALDYLFFNLGGRTHQEGVLRVLDVLVRRWSHGHRPRLWAVDFRPLVEQLTAIDSSRYWQLLLKRYMLRTATAVARRLRLPALVTGEALGQVSSQTLQNLAVISSVTNLLVLRPLVGFNKDDIIDRARAMGTYEASAAVKEYCALLPRHPATSARLEAVLEAEAALDPSVVETAVQGMRRFDLLRLEPDDLRRPDLEVTAVPEGATVLDLRQRQAFDADHLPGALHLDFEHALSSYRSFQTGTTYVLVCEVGLKSAHLAEQMREAGFSAFHLVGGAADSAGSRDSVAVD